MARRDTDPDTPAYQLPGWLRMAHIGFGALTLVGAVWLPAPSIPIAFVAALVVFALLQIANTVHFRGGLSSPARWRSRVFVSTILSSLAVMVLALRYANVLGMFGAQSG